MPERCRCLWASSLLRSSASTLLQCDRKIGAVPIEVRSDLSLCSVRRCCDMCAPSRYPLILCLACKELCGLLLLLEAVSRLDARSQATKPQACSPSPERPRPWASSPENPNHPTCGPRFVPAARLPSRFCRRLSGQSRGRRPSLLQAQGADQLPLTTSPNARHRSKANASSPADPSRPCRRVPGRICSSRDLAPKPNDAVPGRTGALPRCCQEKNGRRKATATLNTARKAFQSFSSRIRSAPTQFKSR